MDTWLAIGQPPGLRIFFSVLFVFVLIAGFIIFRSRKKLFSYKGDASDTYASANLRMAMVVLVWLHALFLTAWMIVSSH